MIVPARTFGRTSGGHGTIWAQLYAFLFVCKPLLYRVSVFGAVHFLRVMTFYHVLENVWKEKRTWGMKGGDMIRGLGIVPSAAIASVDPLSPSPIPSTH